MKKVLFVSQCFPPVLAPESIMVLKKIRALASHVNITIVSLQNVHGHIFPNDPLLEKYIPDNVKVYRMPTFPPEKVIHQLLSLTQKVVLGGSKILRYYDLKWALNATRFIKESLLKSTDFDVLFTNSQGVCSHLVGYLVSKMTDLPWVQHYSDPFVDQNFGRYNFLSRKIDSGFESKFFRSAALITVPSIELRETLFKKNNEKERKSLVEKTIVIPHSFDELLMREALRLYPHRKKYFNADESVNVCYVGSLYGPRSSKYIEHAYQTLHRNLGDKKIKLHIWGFLDSKSRNILERSSISDIVIHGNVGYLESLAIMQHADILLLIDTPAPDSPYFPSKLADYLGTQKIIIVLAYPETPVGRISREISLLNIGFEDSVVNSQNNLEQPMDKRKRFSDQKEIYQPLIDRMLGF